MNKYSYFDQKQINSDSEENNEYDPQHNIRLKMEKIIKLYFIKDIPQVDLSKNEMDRIKENNYQLAVANIEKEKQLFEIYQKEKGMMIFIL